MTTHATIPTTCGGEAFSARALCFLSEDVRAVLEAAMRTVAREEVARALGSARPFSQYNGERPSGSARVKYLRTWRRGRDAGDVECWTEGKARLMTHAAWDRLARATSPAEHEHRDVAPPTPLTIDEIVLAELGGRRRRSA